MKSGFRKTGIVFLHITFWLILLGLPQYMIYMGSETMPSEIKYYTVISSIFIPLTFYIYYLYIVPYTIQYKVRRIYSALSYSIMAVAIITLKTGVLIIIDRSTVLDFEKHRLFSFQQQFAEGFNIVFFILLAILVRIAMYWTRDQRNKTELALKEHQLELELLKAQVNPHFFFNTLNNIYSLVYKKSQDAPAAVMKLSEIMRYLIYESKSEMVPLEKELEQLENYIELEKLRIKDPGFIEYSRKGDINLHTIPPMLLITFAENAFKHGKRKVKNPGITIELVADDRSLKYYVSNYLLKEPASKGPGEGIGMENTRRRLELLYPGKYKLDIIQDSELHRVKLELDCH